jgi:FixJ family two-component response regulator
MRGSRSVIAVVDDDPSIRRAVARFLASCGLEVTTYSSAIEYLADRNVRPVCLVTDVQMPGMSGLELKLHLASSGRDLPVIFVTADDDPRTHARARSLGAAGYFRKPVDAMALLEVLVNIIALGRDD